MSSFWAPIRPHVSIFAKKLGSDRKAKSGGKMDNEVAKVIRLIILDRLRWEKAANYSNPSPVSICPRWPMASKLTRSGRGPFPIRFEMEMSKLCI